MLKQMAALRDLEEAKAHFPPPEPGRLSNNSSMGPVTMAVSGGELEGRPTGQSICTTGKEEGAARLVPSGPVSKTENGLGTGLNHNHGDRTFSHGHQVICVSPVMVISPHGTHFNCSKPVVTGP
jgi:hypothetical protein